MKPLLLIIALFILIHSTTSQAKEKIYSSMGYPYQLLLARADSVKIIYSENDHNIACKVEVSWADKQVLTTPIEVSHKDFTDKPLANCLARKQAKSILSKTFD